MEEKMITSEINRLKKEKNAVILAHNYQIAEIQDIADYVGDSLGLSRTASQTDADIIVFCGVHFMAESAKILSPNKKVLLPVLDAGCPMADMIDLDQLKSFKEKPRGDGAWMNGGFFVCEPVVIDYISGDDTVFEQEPLSQLAQAGELQAHKHEGFWECMDTLRDHQRLMSLWDNNKAPWKSWS